MPSGTVNAVIKEKKGMSGRLLVTEGGEPFTLRFPKREPKLHNAPLGTKVIVTFSRIGAFLSVELAEKKSPKTKKRSP